jgi:4-amino-4-deoxy-L-arabinose transferase-like glycosyltransferase
VTATVDEANVATGESVDERVSPVERFLSHSENRWLLAITVVAFGLRLAWLVYAKAAPPTSWLGAGDQYSYWYYGNEIAAGRGYVGYVTHVPTAYYPIGYPALLAALFFLVLHLHLPGDLMLWAGLMHVLFSTATVALVFLIGRRVFNPTAGLIAAALLAVFPNAIYQVSTLQLETTFIFLSTAALAIIVLHDWSSGLPSRNRLLAFGFVLGLSVLVRPFSVWFVVGVFLAALAVNAGWRRAFAVALVPALVVVAMSIPWIIRNEIRMHAFIITSTNTGDTLCLDRNSTAYGGFRFADHDGCVDPGLPEVPRNAGNTRKAISFVVHHPAREALQIVRRARYEFADDHDGIDATETLGSGPFLRSGVRNALSETADWYFFILLGLAVLGLVPLLDAARRRAEARLVLVALTALLVIPLLLWGNQRFHLPLYPYLVLLAAAVIDFAARRIVRS